MAADQLTPAATVWVTFASAAMGSFLAVAAQAWITRRGSQAHFRSLTQALLNEVEVIEEQATERSNRSSADVRLDPPYPTNAWITLARSPEVRRLKDAYAPLALFYSVVDEANHRTAHIGSLLQISATAADPQIRLEYRNLAQDFSGPSNIEVLSALPSALYATGKLRDHV